MEKTRLLLLGLLVVFISGCAHVISKEARQRADLSLTPARVREDPEKYLGKWVLWGGEVIEAFTQRDGTTLLEIFHRPLGWRGEPKETDTSEGRFLALAEKYLDPYLFRRGRKVTVAGEIQGERTKPLGEMEYRYPLLLAHEIHLWQETRVYFYPYPYYDPWWWGYPYGWRFYFHYHYPRR